MLANTPERYGVLSRALHWLSALIVLALFGVGLVMTELDKQDPLRQQLFFYHMSTGVLLFLLTVVRVIWLKVSPPPPLPGGLAGWERMLTLVVKSLMYLLLLGIPVAGYLIAATAGKPVPFYGLFEIPPLVGESEALHEVFEELHEILAWSLILLALLHIAGALKHRWFDMNEEVDVLRRMT